MMVVHHIYPRVKHHCHMNWDMHHVKQQFNHIQVTTKLEINFVKVIIKRLKGKEICLPVAILEQVNNVLLN